MQPFLLVQLFSWNTTASTTRTITTSVTTSTITPPLHLPPAPVHPSHLSRTAGGRHVHCAVHWAGEHPSTAGGHHVHCAGGYPSFTGGAPECTMHLSYCTAFIAQTWTAFNLIWFWFYICCICVCICMCTSVCPWLHYFVFEQLSWVGLPPPRRGI